LTLPVTIPVVADGVVTTPPPLDDPPPVFLPHAAARPHNTTISA
jgi:hypothetical protein